MVMRLNQLLDLITVQEQQQGICRRAHRPPHKIALSLRKRCELRSLLRAGVIANDSKKMQAEHLRRPLNAAVRRQRTFTSTSGARHGRACVTASSTHDWLPLVVD
jgi:hypothetical protein